MVCLMRRALGALSATATHDPDARGVSRVLHVSVSLLLLLLGEALWGRPRPKLLLAPLLGPSLAPAALWLSAPGEN